MANPSVSAADKWGDVSRWTRRKWKGFVEGVKEQSKVAAAFLPHLLLALPVIAFVYFLPDIAGSISRGWTLVLASMVLPTIWSVRAVQLDDDHAREGALMYWVVYAVCSVLYISISYIPFASSLLESVPYRDELVFFFLLWLQIPFTRGVEIMYVVVPLPWRCSALPLMCA